VRVELKPLREQVIVITGASSGIGRATARMAAERGARVVLAARDREALRDAAEAIDRAADERLGARRRDERRVLTVRCDVADADAVEGVAEAAVRAFGGFDTWVNNAGTSIYGTLDDVSLADMRRLMDVNFWGVVHGSRVAVARLRTGGGALVNVGSVLSDRAVPLQGIYCATKHAVQGFTDALRMELEAEEAPVSVSLVKPASIATPFYESARNYMTVQPRPVPPVYAPEVAARAILRCATRPTRSIYAGGAGPALAAAGGVAPRLTDRAMERALFAQQRGDAAEPNPEGNLWAPDDPGRERGREEALGRHVFERSAWTGAAARPGLTALVAAGLGLAAVAALGGRRGGEDGTR
jgi:short-subunit dehydrogenase